MLRDKDLKRTILFLFYAPEDDFHYLLDIDLRGAYFLENALSIGWGLFLHCTCRMIKVERSVIKLT
jgi:hypothetical protein